MEELNRSVHTWIEESEHSGAGSDDGLSSPSAAGAPISKAAHTSCLDLYSFWQLTNNQRIPCNVRCTVFWLSSGVIVSIELTHCVFMQACRRRRAALLQGRTARRRP